LDGTGRNGVYTAALLDHVRTGGITIEQMFKRVRVSVEDRTNRAQTPWEATSLRGDFYFLAGGAPVARVDTPSPSAPPDPLAEERQGLEEERKKLEVERLKPQQAPRPADGQEVGRDGQYIAFSNGIVKDTKTGLEWVAGIDGGVTWHEANAWVASLNIGGGGWRMPTVEELKGLYQYGKGSRNMTPLLKTTGFYVWSSEPSGGDYICFDFTSGFNAIDPTPPIYSTRYKLNDRRAFAVRSRSGG
jgi:hypothetical protein